ncbi:hypothetical protein Tco_0860383 [Tanacetum coccineum]|uniref:Uncharacterized protein n=1 Tax=Tanacetum coccineum TaxID=301880 RepID=A0ABQ5BER7_9ASTR
MGGSYYPIPCSILSTENDRKTSQRYPDVATTSWRISIRPIYDEEPMAEVQMTTDDNVSATGQQHTKQPEFNNEG